MSNKQHKKIRQIYRKELRSELQHVEVIRREEAQVLLDHVEYIKGRKPALMPSRVWEWIIANVMYR